ncbi:RGD1564712 (predicted) [Rattus norvegicus]|uniref:RGD1564712 n=2 Tax=Rattus norvegicus TaxID=10116 RepID=D3ZWW6_RAT|nr:uncharacterized protein LOC302244 [Rattus norvegicus]EDL88204.1 RGD1564712 (predicted) [Rattus norvegicus]|eukprot:NP_001100401.1 uncharacterized protein LOC302244 [Rattus norvegicus]
MIHESQEVELSGRPSTDEWLMQRSTTIFILQEKKDFYVKAHPQPYRNSNPTLKVTSKVPKEVQTGSGGAEENWKKKNLQKPLLLYSTELS